MLLSAKRLTALVVLSLGLAPLGAGGPVQARPAAAPAAPAYEPDPVPLASGTAWLVDQLGPDHLVTYPIDPGAPDLVTDVLLSMDAAEALDAVGGQDETVDAVTAAVVDHLRGQTAADLDARERAAYLAYLAPRVPDPHDVSGLDLVALLEEVVADSGPMRGAIDEGATTVRAQTATQVDAVRALAAAGSPEAPAARAFLLGLQCLTGAFPFHVAADWGGGPPCREFGFEATPRAIKALEPALGTPVVRKAVERAAAWLIRQQTRDGAIEDVEPSADPSSLQGRQTGATVWALQEVRGQVRVPGLDAAIARGRAWVRGLQRRGTSEIAGSLPDESALDQDYREEEGWFYPRGTADALPALRGALRTPGRARPLERSTVWARSAVPGKVHLNDVVDLPIGNADPGEWLHLVDGAKRHTVVAGLGHDPTWWAVNGAGRTTYRVEDAIGAIGTVTIRTVDPEWIKPRVRARVERGAQQRVRLRGLAAHEPFTIRVAGKVLTGRADARGRVTRTLRVRQRSGKVTVRFTGAIEERRGRTTFRIAR